MDWSRPESLEEDAIFTGGAISLNVVFPGYDGIPFRGRAIPNLKNDDARQPEEVWDGQSQSIRFQLFLMMSSSTIGLLIMLPKVSTSFVQRTVTGLEKLTI
jgi:hypothetical protein